MVDFLFDFCAAFVRYLTSTLRRRRSLPAHSSIECIISKSSSSIDHLKYRLSSPLSLMSLGGHRDWWRFRNPNSNKMRLACPLRRWLRGIATPLRTRSCTPSTRRNSGNCMKSCSWTATTSNHWSCRIKPSPRMWNVYWSYRSSAMRV